MFYLRWGKKKVSKKVIFLVARPSPPILVAGPLKKKNFFCGFPYLNRTFYLEQQGKHLDMIKKKPNTEQQIRHAQKSIVPPR